MSRKLTTILASLILGCVVARGQALSYSLLASEAPQPSPRFDGAIVYEPGSQAVYLFGGSDGAARNDVWSYSLSARRWTEVQAVGSRPAPRFGHTVIFDPLRRRLVVFGGQAGGFFSDVWAFEVDNRRWVLLAGSEAGPSDRYGHSAIYDTARDRMVISHGFTDSGRFDDTWAFNLTSNSWRNITPQGPRPLRRCLHSATYDPAAQRMLLYGGCASGFGPCPLGDLWSFDLNAGVWSEKTGGVKPPAREYPGLYFDTKRGRLAVFGGAGPGPLNDTWEYDPGSSTWRQTEVMGELPRPRQRHGTAFASDLGVAFFFGGNTANGPSNELFMLAASAPLIRPVVDAQGLTSALDGSSGPFSAGQLLSISGSGLGPEAPMVISPNEESGALPTTARGVAVSINGVAAPLVLVSAIRLIAQVPGEVRDANEARLSVEYEGVKSEEAVISVGPRRPLLSATVVNENGSVNSPWQPTLPGSMITIEVDPQGGMEQPLTVRIGDLEAEVVEMLLSRRLLRVRIPDESPRGSVLPVVAAAGQEASRSKTVVHIR